MAIGIQSVFLALQPEANRIRRIHGWFDPRHFGEHGPGSSQVRDRFDNSASLIHMKLLSEVGANYIYMIKILHNMDNVKDYYRGAGG